MIKLTVKADYKHRPPAVFFVTGYIDMVFVSWKILWALTRAASKQKANIVQEGESESYGVHTLHFVQKDGNNSTPFISIDFEEVDEVPDGWEPT